MTEYRKPVGIATDTTDNGFRIERVWVVCEDGSISKWESFDEEWYECAPVPGTKAAAEQEAAGERT